MKRIALLLVSFALLAVPLLVGVQPAQAGFPTACTAFSVTSVHKNQGGDIRMQGSITCASGYRWRGQIIVGQPHVLPIVTQAKGHLDPTDATGSAQAWVAKATTNAGSFNVGSSTGWQVQVHASNPIIFDTQSFFYSGNIVVT
jgi:hypothetical protein